jgi:hypothetical protein
MASIDLVEGLSKRPSIPTEQWYGLNGQTRVFDVLYCLIGSVPGNGFLRQLNPDSGGSAKSSLMPINKLPCRDYMLQAT